MTTKVAVGLILGCALVGGYTSMFTSYQYGYLDALRNCVSSLPSEACILDMSGAVTPSITGVNAIDDLLNILFQFFSQGLSTDPHIEGTDLEALLAFVYLAAQFGGAWYIIALEGLRGGNKGSILSWTGSFGAIFQAITVTIVAPIYLTLQLLRSSSDRRIETLLVNSFDLNLLPLSAVLAYVLPTAALCLPLFNLIHGKTKLLAVAFWQPFPLYHTIIRSLSTKLGPKIYYEDNTPSTAELERCRKALRKSNRIITSLAVAVHVAVMSTVFTASRATGLIASVSARHIFALTSIQSPPATVMLHPPVSLLDSREIVVAFLRWDVYCTCLAMLTWALHQRYTTVNSRSLLILVFKALLYALVGGPIFPSLMFIWERDNMVLDMIESSREKIGSEKPSKAHISASGSREMRKRARQ